MTIDDDGFGNLAAYGEEEEEDVPCIHSIAPAFQKSTMTLHCIIESTRTHIGRFFGIFPCLLKYIVNFPRTKPRVWTSVAGVLLPLWILFGLTLIFAEILASYEMPEEIFINDRILASREILKRYEVVPDDLLSLTGACLTSWQLDTFKRTEDTLFNGNFSDMITDGLPGAYYCPAEMSADLSNMRYLNETAIDEDDLVLIDLGQLNETLQTCVDSYAPSLAEYKSLQQRHITAADPLSFNWIRCWNESLFGDTKLIFYPTDEMIKAAHSAAQTEYFSQEWSRSQEKWFRHYLPENATSTESVDAFFKSVEHATGGSVCVENLGGTAWFFFTVISTVGYGNQAPVTSEGRLLIATVGLMSSILFGTVLGLCAYMSLTIFDGAVRRVKYAAILSKPVVGVLFWGSIWLCFAFVVAKDVENWWDTRFPEYGEGVDREDSLWFAFISMSTIGLGDYYLPSETFFIGDALKYSLHFLIGFVFLSNFVGKIAESLRIFLPRQQTNNSLETRLGGTKIFGCWPGSITSSNDGQSETNHPLLLRFKDDDNDEDALRYRIEQLKKLKPSSDEVETDVDTSSSSSSSTNSSSMRKNLRGISSLHQAAHFKLLLEEETILREWLKMVKMKQRRAMRKNEKEIGHAQPFLTLETIIEDEKIIDCSCGSSSSGRGSGTLEYQIITSQ